jgi:hypothetical protein
MYSKAYYLFINVLMQYPAVSREGDFWRQNTARGDLLVSKSESHNCKRFDIKKNHK